MRTHRLYLGVAVALAVVSSLCLVDALVPFMSENPRVSKFKGLDTHFRDVLAFYNKYFLGSRYSFLNLCFSPQEIFFEPSLRFAMRHTNLLVYDPSILDRYDYDHTD